MKQVSGHHAPKRGELHKITIEKAHNGFSVQRHHASVPGQDYMSRPPEEPPAVFNKHAAAKKHIGNLMAEMHPPDQEPSTGMMTGNTPMDQQS